MPLPQVYYVSECLKMVPRKKSMIFHFWVSIVNKKVLLRERKRHTACRVAIVSPCYSGGGGGPSTKTFFSSLNMYQAKSGVKNFSLYRWEGGSLDKNFFCQSEHVSSQIWCQKFFSLPVGGGCPSTKNFFASLNMYQAKSGVKIFSLY